MSDIVERLQRREMDEPRFDEMPQTIGICGEAAAEIKLLRAALSWIEDQDPQIVDTAREKFGIPDPRALDPPTDVMVCNCRKCIRDRDERDEAGYPIEWSRMIVCRECGNKRCPHANDHRYACTGSNELGHRWLMPKQYR